ncbi:MAG TPA: dienelactone hydrolase family protein [Lichenihabitans sp.]|jgi:carboxymethylenebutenolidase|nr:dienelactone hydrolase family protein [Lichenihabitans sp.]
MGQRISFNQPDGKSAGGYLATAAGVRRGGVVVIQEWWGLQDQITGICDRLGEGGFDALAPDLYAGTVIPYHDIKSADHEMNALDFREATDQPTRGAAQHLLGAGGKVGITGFCLGGIITVLGACRIPELSCGVAYYGLPSPEDYNPAAIRIPLQGHFADEDNWCKPEHVDAFEQAVEGAGKEVAVFRYAAKHGFVNEQLPQVFDRATLDQAWRRTLAFFDEHLG